MSTFITITERRNHDKKLLAPFKAFEAITGREVFEQVSSTCGNIARDLGEIYELVSAPYLAARLMAAGFTPEVSGQEGYKTTFEFYLRHKETKHILTFYDYKGSSSYGSDVYGGSMPLEFKLAAAQVIAALTNDRFPHPYDGCVVGEIA